MPVFDPTLLGELNYQAKWVSFNRHRAEVVATNGQWMGLLNENGEFVCDLPPAVSMKAPALRGAAGALELTIQVVGEGRWLHPVVAELVGDFYTLQAAEGYLVPNEKRTRFVVIEREGIRFGYRVEFVQLIGSGDRPTMMTIHGTELVKVLARFPSISRPESWLANLGVWADRTSAWSGVGEEKVQFRRPRQLRNIEMGKAAFRRTLWDFADKVIIAHLIRSLSAAYRMAGIGRDQPVQVEETRSGVPSPMTYLQISDKSLWDDLAPVAAEAGVTIAARWWFPGDPQPEGLQLRRPTIVISVIQGQKARQTLREGFEHEEIIERETTVTG